MDAASPDRDRRYSGGHRRVVRDATRAGGGRSGGKTASPRGEWVGRGPGGRGLSRVFTARRGRESLANRCSETRWGCHGSAVTRWPGAVRVACCVAGGAGVLWPGNRWPWACTRGGWPWRAGRGQRARATARGTALAVAGSGRVLVSRCLVLAVSRFAMAGSAVAVVRWCRLLAVTVWVIAIATAVVERRRGEQEQKSVRVSRSLVWAGRSCVRAGRGVLRSCVCWPWQKHFVVRMKQRGEQQKQMEFTIPMLTPAVPTGWAGAFDSIDF